MLYITRHFFSVAFTLVLVFDTSLVSAQRIQWLQYHTAQEARSIVGGMGTVALKSNHETPLGVALPEFTSEQPYFAQWSSPLAHDGYLWLALDRAGKTGPYDRLFLDSNANGSLADETAVTPYRVDTQAASFGPVKVIFTGADGPISYHLNFIVYDNHSLYVSSAGWYEGEIKIGQDKRKCLLIDQNANGVFNDMSLDRNQSDRIRIDSFAGYVGKFLNINDEMFKLEIAPDGAHISLTPATDIVYSTVQLPQSITEFAAVGENGLFNFQPVEGIVRLPIGKYRIEHWAIERQDEQGKPWRLEGINSSEKGDFEVNPVNESQLQIGEPVYSTLTVSKVLDTSYSIDQALKGSLGESINITLPSGIRPQPPRVNIRNEDGSYDRTFTMEYMCGYTGSLYWQRPQNVKGPYTVSHNIAGPFRIETQPVTINLEPAGISVAR